MTGQRVFGMVLSSGRVRTRVSSSRALRSRLLGFSLLVGSAVAVLGSVFALAMTSLSVHFQYPAIHPLALPGLPEGFSLAFSVRSLQTETLLLEWAFGLLTDLLYVVVWAGYYVGLAIVVSGVGLIVAGTVSTQQDRSMALLKRLIGQRWFQLTLALVFASGVVAANPLLVRLVVEGLLVLVVGGSILGVTAGSALYIYERADTPLAVLALYPLLISVGLLPPAGVMLALPALRGWFQSASLRLAIWLLDYVLAVGGLNALIRRSFQIQGHYFHMWVAIALTLGWLLGGAVLLKRAVVIRTNASVPKH